MNAYKADWRNQDLYPSPLCEDPLHLAWEFLRRNKKYAIEVSKILAEKAPGADVDAKHKKPSSLFINRWSLETPVLPSQDYDPSIVKFLLHEIKLKRPKSLKRQSFNLRLNANEIAVRLRLDMKLLPQLLSVVDRLKEETQAYDEIVSKKSGKVAHLRDIRQDSVFERAHCWLRCFDAYQAPIVYVDGDTKRKRLRKGGPIDIVEQFKSEVTSDESSAISTAENLKQKVGKKDGRLGCNKKNPPDWKDRAAEYINDKHYLKLLYPKTPPKTIDELGKVLRAWKKQSGTY